MIDERTRPMAAAFHVRHCDAEDNGSAGHVCQGKVTITAAQCLFECGRCGIDSANIRQEVERIRAEGLRRRDELLAFGNEVSNGRTT